MSVWAAHDPDARADRDEDGEPICTLHGVRECGQMPRCVTEMRNADRG
jgi:hypothetical protein